MAASREQLAVALDARAGATPQARRTTADPRRPGRAEAEPAQAPLARTLDGAVIPRLVLADRVARARRESATATADDRAGELAELVLARDSDVARRFVDALHARGASFEQLYLEVVAPAARRLGDFWTDDRCHFTDVTLAMSRLHHMLHLLGHVFYAEDPHTELPRRALLLPAPGEQHSFGLAMVAEFFRRAGWDVWSGATLARADLLRLVGRERFDLVGLSTGCDAKLDGLPTLVHAVRHRSRNPDVGVFVGGPAFLAHPELATAVGADATALDGRQAVAQAEELLAMRTGRRGN
ncbi:MAG: B12-binding domain-containing protein [Alphaproteobacteria bacterium]